MCVYVCVCVCVSALSGEDIESHHCSIMVDEDEGSKVKLLVDKGKCYVNHTQAEEDTDLSHGTYIRTL